MRCSEQVDTEIETGIQIESCLKKVRKRQNNLLHPTKISPLVIDKKEMPLSVCGIYIQTQVEGGEVVHWWKSGWVSGCFQLSVTFQHVFHGETHGVCVGRQCPGGKQTWSGANSATVWVAMCQCEVLLCRCCV